MNVLDTRPSKKLGAIVDQTTADAAVKGVVITSARRRSPPCGPLDARGHEQDLCRSAESKGKEAAQLDAVR